MVRTLEFDVCEMALTTYLTAKAHGVRVHRAPGLPGPRLPPRRDPVRPADRHRAAPEGPGRPAGRRQPRLHGHHRRLGAGDPARRARRRPRLGDLGALRRRARRGVPAAAERGAPIGSERPARSSPATSPRRCWTASWPPRSAYPPDRPELAPLIADPEAAGYAALAERGHYPINHLVVVRDELLAEHPDLAAAVFDAFAESKRRYVDQLRRRCPSRRRPTGCTGGSWRSPAPTRCRTARAQPAGAGGAGPGRGRPAHPRPGAGPGRAVRARHPRPGRLTAVRIAIAADHNGVAIKARLIERLSAAGHELDDRGTHGDADRGLPAAVRGRLPPGRPRVRPTAASSSAAAAPASWWPATRCAASGPGCAADPCHDRDHAGPTTTRTCSSSGPRWSRRSRPSELVDLWLRTAFQGGVHQRRIDMIAALERGESLL